MEMEMSDKKIQVEVNSDDEKDHLLNSKSGQESGSEENIKSGLMEEQPLITESLEGQELKHDDDLVNIGDGQEEASSTPNDFSHISLEELEVGGPASAQDEDATREENGINEEMYSEDDEVIAPMCVDDQESMPDMFGEFEEDDFDDEDLFEVVPRRTVYRRKITQTPAEWSIQNIQMFGDNKRRFPTDTFGQIKVNEESIIEYVRLSHDTSPEDVYKLINQHWGKPPPILAVSLIGEGDLKTCINKPASEKIFESMEKVISTPRTCLISDGKYKLNQRLMESSPTDTSFMHLGIAHFGSLDIKQCFIDAEPRSCMEGLPTCRTLNFSHTHLLLVDDGNNEEGAEIEFRSNFENFLFTASNDLTQIVSFAMGGEDDYTLKMLAKTIQYQIPLFVVKQGNNQDGADYLVTLLEEQKEREQKSNELNGGDSKKKSVKFILQEKAKEGNENIDVVDGMGQFKDLMKSSLENVGNMQQITLIDGSQDVTELFLEAIMKNAVSEIDKDTTIMLYVLWNQGDEFWNKNVFARFYPKGNTDTTVVIFMALALNRVDFLKSFRDSLIYKAFEQFTDNELIFLYWYRALGCPLTEKTGVLKKLVKEVVMSKKENSDEDGNCCSCFKACCCRGSEDETNENSSENENESTSTEAEEDQNDEEGGGIFKSSFVKFFCNITGITEVRVLTDMDIIDGVMGKLDEGMFNSDISTLQLKKLTSHDITGFFIWAVLNGMQEMSLLLMDFVDQKCSRALIGAAISTTIAANEKLPESLRMVYSGMASTFEDVAVGIVEHGYKMDAKRNKDLITRELDFIEGYTCVDLAIATKKLKFISHQSVHNIFNHIWRGPWKYQFTIIDFICFFVPCYLSQLEYRSEKQLRELSELFGKRIYLRDEWNFSTVCGLNCQNVNKEEEEEENEKEKKKQIMDPKTGKTRQYTITKNYDNEEEKDKNKNTSCGGRFSHGFGEFTYKMYLYFRTPKVKFFWHLISFLIFLGLMSYSVLEDKKTTDIRLIDWILLSFILSMTTHEIYQWIDSPSKKGKWKIYFRSFWNRMDFVALLLFFVGFTLQAFTMTQEYGRLILAFDAYIWIVRSLRVLYFFRVVGPYVLMIQIMLMDVLKFIIILLIFTVAHGVCFTAIMSPQNRSWNMLRDVIFHPYYNIYGELFFGDETDSTTIFGTEKRNAYGSTLGLIMLAVYVLIANVLLLNLLIAIFGNTYGQANENAHRIWAYQRYKLTVEYSQRSILVPPFSILSHVWTFLCWICRCCSTEKKIEFKRSTFSKRLEKGRNNEINKFESTLMKNVGALAV